MRRMLPLARAARFTAAFGLIFCVATARGSGADVPREIERAIIKRDDVKQACAIEVELQAKARQDPPAGEQWFRFVPGTSSVLVVAPHATVSVQFDPAGTSTLFASSVIFGR